MYIYMVFNDGEHIWCFMVIKYLMIDFMGYSWDINGV